MLSDRNMEYFVTLVLYCFTYVLDIVSSGNGRYFVTESCGSVIGPDYGAYLEFHQDSRQNSDGSIDLPESVKGNVFDCVIVVRGMPSTGETRYMSIYWRNFHLREKDLTTIEHDPDKCGKAYVTIYSGKDTNVAEHHTFCGAGALPSHLEWEGEYATLKFHIDFSAPPTMDESFEYPEVYFRLDITSFDYDCQTSVENVILRCNDSKRCLDDSLRCDYWFSRNCQSVRFPRDNTDTSRHPPANCFQKKVTTTTTTTPVPPTPPPDYTALYVILTLICSFLAFFWCCWRPGYIPWRFGRLRNAPCFHAFGKCIPCCVHASPFCAFLGQYPCCRCCAEGYGMSPTGGSAWLETKPLEALSLNEERSACASDTSGSTSKKKTLTEKILPCVGRKSKDSATKSTTGSSKLVRRTNSVKPLERILDEEGKDENEKVRQRRQVDTGQGDSYTQKEQTDDGVDNMSDGPECFATGNKWLQRLTSDGAHLREHRL